MYPENTGSSALENVRDGRMKTVLGSKELNTSANSVTEP